MIVWFGAYVATAVAFLACDAVWLGLMASRLYRPRLGALMRDDVLLAPAAAFYLLYIAGILVFAIAPAFDSGRWTTALGRGALFGLIAYATYDLTNQATLRGWSSLVTIADLGWGATLTGVAATIGFSAARMIAARG